MAKYNKAINNFTSGKLDPKLRSRIGTEQYANGLEDSVNMLPFTHGGMGRRPGFQHVSTLQAEWSVPTAWTNATFGSTAIPYTGINGESFIFLIPNTTTVLATDKPLLYNTADGSYTIVNLGDTSVTATSWQYPAKGYHYTQFDTRLFLTHRLGTMPPMKLEYSPATGYTFQSLSFVPTGSLLVAELWQRFALTPFAPANSNKSSFMEIRSNTGTLYVKTGTPGNILASPTATRLYNISTPPATGLGTPIGGFWDSSYENTFFRVTQKDGSGNPIELVFFVDTVDAGGTWANGYIIIEAFDATASENWSHSAFSDGLGWPTCITSYNQRVVIGGAKSFPATIYASYLSGPESYFNDILDQDFDQTADISGIGVFGLPGKDFSFYFTPAGALGSKTQWLSATDSLVVGTEQGELIVRPIDGQFSAGFINIETHGNKGSLPLRPVEVDGLVLHTTRNGRGIAALSYSAANGDSQSTKMTLISERIVDFEPSNSIAQTLLTDQSKYNTFATATYDTTRDIVWYTTGTGTLLAFHIDNTNKQAGWFPQELGGSSSVLGYGNAAVDDTAFIYDSDNHGNLYAIVLRETANDDVSIFLEKMNPLFENNSLLNESVKDPDKPIFSDGAKWLRYDSVSPFAFSNINVSVADDWVGVATGGKDLHPFMEVTFDLITGTVPTGLTDATNYWLVPNTLGFRLATSLANALADTYIDITAAPAGTYTLTGQSETSLSYWGGLDHLSGQVVDILADGIYVGQKTVDDKGWILLDSPATTELVVGLPYEAYAVTVPIEAGGQFGASRGHITRIDHATLMLYNTHYGLFGDPAEETLYEMELPEVNYTGDLRFDFPQSPDRIARMKVKSDKPLPMNLLGVIAEGQSFDG